MPFRPLSEAQLRRRNAKANEQRVTALGMALRRMGHSVKATEPNRYGWSGIDVTLSHSLTKRKFKNNRWAIPGNGQTARLIQPGRQAVIRFDPVIVGDIFNIRWFLTELKPGR